MNTEPSFNGIDLESLEAVTLDILKTRNNIANALTEIVTLYDRLPDEYEHRSLGKDASTIAALNLHGPAANLEAWEHRYEASEAAGGPDYADDQIGTEVHPELVLTDIESEIRDARNLPTDLDTNLHLAATLIRHSLDWMFDHTQHEQGFWNRAPVTDTRLHKVRTHLENATMDGTRHEWSEVECLACGEKLCQRMTYKGIEDEYWCHGCYRHLAPAEYHLARKQHALNDLLAEI